MLLALSRKATTSPGSSNTNVVHSRSVRAACVAVAVGGVLVSAGVFSASHAGLPKAMRASANVPVTPMDRETQVANNSPELLEDPIQPRLLLMANRVDFPDFSCALQASGDFGHGWVRLDPVPVLPEGVQKCYAPEIAFNSSGKLYYLFVGLAGPGNQPVGAFLTSSSDNGRSFSRPRRLLGPDNFSVRMAIDSTQGREGRIYLVWLHASTSPGTGFGPPPNPILLAHSDDGGRTFSAPAQLTAPSTALAVAPSLAVSPGHVYVTYYDLGRDAVDYEGVGGPTWAGTWSLMLVRSLDGGAHFDSAKLVTGIRPPGRVMLIFTMPPAALVAREDRLCAAWTDARLGDPDALARCSPDAGAAWDRVVRLNDDPVGDGVTQGLPAMSIAPDGRVDAIFVDRRSDPANVLQNVSYTYSVDGGRTFVHNIKLTDMPSSSHIGARYAGFPAQGQYEFGSRLGLLSTATGAIAAWPDTRNSFPNTSGQDIFATRVQLLMSEAPWWPRAAGAIVAVAGLAGFALLWRRRRTADGTPVGA